MGVRQPENAIDTVSDPFLQEADGLLYEQDDQLQQTDAYLKALERTDRFADRLHVPPHELHWAPAGRDAGKEAGRVFCHVLLDGRLWIAVRHDSLVAYLTGLSDRSMLSSQKIAQVLTAHGLCNVAVPPLNKLRARSGSGLRRWVRVATGRPRVRPQPDQIQLPVNGPNDQVLSIEDLSVASIELDALLTSNPADPCAAQELGIPFVAPGQVVARRIPGRVGQDGQDVFGDPVPCRSGSSKAPAGDGIEGDDPYRATRYGYLCLQDGCLSVVSPVRVDAEWVEAHWLLLDRRPEDLPASMLTDALAGLGVTEGILESRIEELLILRRAGQLGCGTHLVAQGTRPLDGHDARLEISLPTARQSGRERPDGSIDFREVNYTANVEQGQEVARFQPATRGVAGRNLRGEMLRAVDGKEGFLEAGDNVRVEALDDGGQRFNAAVDGALRVDRDRISVVELLAIQGDVNYTTGNLRFAGEVFIKGSVLQGFSVKADGDITVSETVEAGALVTSLGDVRVGRGVLGRHTKVVAKGNLRAQFAQEATLVAGGDLEVGNYAYHAHLRAAGRVRMAKGSGRRGGSIVGGQT